MNASIHRQDVLEAGLTVSTRRSFCQVYDSLASGSYQVTMQGEPSRDSSEYEPSTGYSTDDGTPARTTDQDWGHRNSLHNSQSDLASAQNGSSRAELLQDGELVCFSRCTDFCKKHMQTNCRSCANTRHDLVSLTSILHYTNK